MRIDVPSRILAAQDLGAVHFIGIGGAGLSAIARLLHQQGVRVSGSDQSESPELERLRSEGIEVFTSHGAENIAGVDTVIVSTAVPHTNPEVRKAQALGLRVWPRSAGLMSAMLDEKRLAVAGTHGKTTTTAMLTLALTGTGLDVSFAIGAQVPALGTNARHGTAGVIVVEADESDGAFLHYVPHSAVITNIDADHLDTWGTTEAYEQAFAQFVDTVSGNVVVSADDPGCQRLLAHHSDRITSVGFGRTAQIRGRNLRVDAQGSRFSIDLPDGSSHEVSLAVSGAHYALDALLAFVAAWQHGAKPQGIIDGLVRYTGASRRMERKGTAAGIEVVDSYAHHPTEIAADLSAARAMAGDRRLVVVFQPHLVSRTRIFAREMGRELSAADVVRLVDIYLAREEADPEVSSQLVSDAVTETDVALIGPVDGLAERLAPELLPGDFVLTLGAGDVTAVGPRLLELLAEGNRIHGA